MQRINISTFIAFLCGSRHAIECVIRSRQAMWVGALFVLSAGFAREYDGEDLLHEPWHLLIPVLVSSCAAFLLFCLLAMVVGAPHRKLSEFRLSLPALITGYWFMAPMAWFYAIPVERFLSPPDAIRANLFLLAGVSLWRVLLMSRIVAILLQRAFLPSVFPVMLFADVVAIAALQLAPRPIVDLMGGIRHTEGELILSNTVFCLTAAAVISLPIWLIGTIVFSWRQKKPEPNDFLLTSDRPAVSGPLVGLGVMLVLIGFGILPLAQDEQRNRRTVERLMRSGQIKEALAYMSARERSDFPPHWDIPPRIGYGQRTPSLAEVVLATHQKRVAPWVKQVYWDKFTFYNQAAPYEHSIPPMPFRPSDMTEQELEVFVDVLLKQPDREWLALNHADHVKHVLDTDANLSSRQRELLMQIHEISGRTYKAKTDVIEDDRSP